MKKRANHHSCRKGKRVQVKLSNGDMFVDKFVEEQSRFLVFDSNGKIAREKIISFKIFKGK